MTKTDTCSTLVYDFLIVLDNDRYVSCMVDYRLRSEYLRELVNTAGSISNVRFNDGIAKKIIEIIQF